ncbi:MAG: DUF3107 domain-containing protein [Acidimicrobiales bacterium]
MDIRIGVSDSPREIEIEAAESVTQEEVEKAIHDALTSGIPVVWLSDKRGRRVGVPSGKIAYIEIGPNKSERRVGFSAP